MRGYRPWQVSHLFRREISRRIDSKSSLGTPWGSRYGRGDGVGANMWFVKLIMLLKNQVQMGVWNLVWEACDLETFSDPKKECYTWSPQKGLHMVGYTWWATHGLFFLPFLKDVCSKTMCRPPCVALPFVTFRRMSAGKTMCSPLPFDQRREGYTWWSTHGLFFLPFLKDVCSKTMCRPPCVALSFGISGRREEGYSWSFLQTSFENGRKKRPCVTSFPPTRDSKKGGLHMVRYTWFLFFLHFWRISAAKPCVAHHV